MGISEDQNKTKQKHSQKATKLIARVRRLKAVRALTTQGRAFHVRKSGRNRVRLTPRSPANLKKTSKQQGIPYNTTRSPSQTHIPLSYQFGPKPARDWAKKMRSWKPKEHHLQACLFIWCPRAKVSEAINWYKDGNKTKQMKKKKKTPYGACFRC